MELTRPGTRSRINAHNPSPAPLIYLAQTFSIIDADPLASIAYLITISCDPASCEVQYKPLEDALGRTRAYLPIESRQRWLLAGAAVVVLLGWLLTFSSDVWYNRTRLSSIRKRQWQDQLVVITGGASGIGYRTAVRLAAKGAKVVVIDIQKLPSAEPGTASWKALESSARSNISAYICDVASEDALAKVLKSILAIHGVPTVVINNAGLTHSQPITSLSTAQLSRLINVNLTSHLWILQHLLAGMVQRAKLDGTPAHIVSIASVMGHTGVSQMIDYCASKHGVVGLHKALRYELDYCHGCPQIRTTLVVLGHVDTPLFRGFRPGWLARFLGPSVEPDAVARSIVAAVGKRRGGTIALPWYANWSEAFALLPSWATDFAHWLLGSNRSMEEMNRARQKSA